MLAVRCSRRVAWRRSAWTVTRGRVVLGSPGALDWPALDRMRYVDAAAGGRRGYRFATLVRGADGLPVASLATTP